MAAPGCESAWHSAQLPSCWVFFLEAQAQEGFASHLIVMFIYFFPRVTGSSHFPFWHFILLNHLHIKLQGILCNLSAGIVRVQMTTTTPSPPPAVNSLLLDPDNHLPSAALHGNALPHGLITTTLFHLYKEWECVVSCMSYCHGTAAWNQRRRLVHSVWSVSIFDTWVVSLILNPVPPEAGKQIRCDNTVTVELHRLAKSR